MWLLRLKVAVGRALDVSWSSDSVEPAPAEYKPLPRERSMTFESASVCSMAARFTERWMDQATRPRQASTEKPRKPSRAPTMMKTKPSGSVDCCINGAFAVGGTDGGGYENCPDSVGRFVGSEPPRVADDPLPVIVGGAV